MSVASKRAKQDLMRSPSERRGREGLRSKQNKTKPRDYEEICERLFAPSPASKKQIENLPQN